MAADLAALLPPQATAPEHARAVDALRAHDPVGYAEAIDDLVGAHLAQRDEQRTADLLTGLGSDSLARAWTPTDDGPPVRAGLAWFTPTERLLAELPPPDRADVVVVVDAGGVGVDRALLGAAAPRLLAVAAPGARAGGTTLLSLLYRASALVIRGRSTEKPGRVVPLPHSLAALRRRFAKRCDTGSLATLAHPRHAVRPRAARPGGAGRGLIGRASRFPDLRRSPNVATVTQTRTDDHPVSRFGHVEPADLPDDLRERIEAIAEKSGFVPNVFRALARRPAELRAFLDYHDALMEREGGLSKAERELVVVATSGANHCVYCVVAHGAILRIRAKDTEIADRVATNPWTAPLPAARAGHRRPRPGPRHRACPTVGRAPRRRARRGARRRRDLGRRRHHRAVRALQPDGAPDRIARRTRSSS